LLLELTVIQALFIVVLVLYLADVVLVVAALDFSC